MHFEIALPPLLTPIPAISITSIEIIGMLLFTHFSHVPNVLIEFNALQVVSGLEHEDLNEHPLDRFFCPFAFVAAVSLDCHLVLFDHYTLPLIKLG